MSTQTTIDDHRDPGEFTVPTVSDGETFVRTLHDNYGFCNWCWSALEAAPLVTFPGEPEARALPTGDAYDDPVEDVPPHREDDHGNITEYSRDKRTICDECGVIDPSPSDSRDKETTWIALTHLFAILKANDVDTNPHAGERALTEAFAEGRTGQACQVLGEAIYEGTPD